MGLNMGFLILSALLLTACSTMMPVAALTGEGGSVARIDEFRLGVDGFSIRDGSFTYGVSLDPAEETAKMTFSFAL